MLAANSLPDWLAPDSPTIDQAVRRAASMGFESWWRKAESVGFCAHPIQLVGTDEFGREQVVWVRCNNRRKQVCPSCSDLYARDTWQLVHAGTAGGHHDMALAVAARPQVFVTLTAPGFGPVHSPGAKDDGAGRVCRDHKKIGGYLRCPHGKPLWCSQAHDHSDLRVGEPLCQDCYDYVGHVLFTWNLPELWRRFTIALRRALVKKVKAVGIQPGSIRVSFVKVVEMQARAIPHIHALIRLDPTNPDTDTGTADSGDPNIHGPAATNGGGERRCETDNVWQSPLSAAELAVLIQQAARQVNIAVPDPNCDDPVHDAPLMMRFGTQIDTQPLIPELAVAQVDSDACESAGRLSPCRVAGYLAKYVTKSLHDFGIAASRLTTEAISGLEVSEHVREILTTVALLDGDAHRGITTLSGIGRWLHTLGYRGHITTKSRLYSTTMTALRVRRAQWTRETYMRCTDSEPVPGGGAGGVDGSADIAGDVLWEFDRAGHTTLGDRALIVSAALRRIESRRVGLAEYRDQSVQREQGAVS